MIDLAFVGRLAGACVVIALVLAALQIVAARLGRARALPGSRGRLMALVESTQLSGAAALHVVRIVDRYYVLGCNAASVATLAEIPNAAVEARVAERAAEATAAFAPIARYASRFGRCT